MNAIYNNCKKETNSWSYSLAGRTMTLVFRQIQKNNRVQAVLWCPRYKYSLDKYVFWIPFLIAFLVTFCIWSYQCKHHVSQSLCEKGTIIMAVYHMPSKLFLFTLRKYIIPIQMSFILSQRNSIRGKNETYLLCIHRNNNKPWIL